MPENQITTNFIYLISSNFVAISHINYWDQANSWKNLWNGPLSKNKSGPFPLLNVAAYWQSTNTKICTEKLSQILANNIDNGGRVFGIRIYVRYCLKKLVKNKRGFGKTCHFFLAETHYSWCLEYALWSLWPSRKLKRLS